MWLFPPPPLGISSTKSSETGPRGHGRGQGCLEEALSVLALLGICGATSALGRCYKQRAGEMAE